MSLISPLNRVLGLGSAKDGPEHWWMQRLTAAALVPLGLWFAFSLASLETSSYAAVVAWIQEPMTGVLLILSLTTLVYHSYLGIQVVVEDYVAAHGTKVAVLAVSAFAHVFLLTTALYSVLRVAFGGV